MSDVMNFVDSLPTRKVGGVGKVLEKMLYSFNLMTMKDVRENMETVLFSFTPASADFLLHTTLGIAISEGKIRKDIIKLGDISEDIGRKSLGAERTFSLCCELYSDQKKKLRELCQKVSNELKEKNLWGKTVTLKVKTIKFELFTRSLTNKNYFQNSDIIEKIAFQLLETVIPIKIRLIGVTISKFITKKSTIQYPATANCLPTTSTSSSTSTLSSTTSSSLIRKYFTSTEDKARGIQNNDLKCRESVSDNENNKNDDNNDDDDDNNNDNGYGDCNDVHIYNSERHARDDNHDYINGDYCDNDERAGDHYDDYCYDKYDNNYNEHSNYDDDSNNNNNNNNSDNSNSNNSSSGLRDDSGDSKYEELHNHDIEVEMVRDKDRDRERVDVSQRILYPTASSSSHSISTATSYSSSIPNSNDIMSSLPFTPSSTSFSSTPSSSPLPSSSSTSSSSSSSSSFASSSSSNLSSRLTLTQQQHFPCPICHKTVYGTLLALNMHIDQCLLVGSSIPHSLGKNVPRHAKNVLSFNNVMYHTDEPPTSTSTSTSTFDNQERRNSDLKNKRFNGDNLATTQAAKKTKSRHQNVRPKEMNLVGHNSNRITNFLYHDTKKC